MGESRADSPGSPVRMPSAFTMLPWEIRNEIYSHVFDHDSIKPYAEHRGKRLPLTPSPRSSIDFYVMSDPQKALALLYVSHQISVEAAAYFYGKSTFRGEWDEIAALVKGTAACHRDMIRSVEILLPVRHVLDFHRDGTFELLSRLPNLRIVRINASNEDFTRLQNELLQGDILKLAGVVDIDVYNTWCGQNSTNLPPYCRQCYRDRYAWSCARGTTQWVGGERIRTVTWKLSEDRLCWVSTEDPRIEISLRSTASEDRLRTSWPPRSLNIW